MLGYLYMSVFSFSGAQAYRPIAYFCGSGCYIFKILIPDFRLVYTTVQKFWLLLFFLKKLIILFNKDQ